MPVDEDEADVERSVQSFKKRARELGDEKRREKARHLEKSARCWQAASAEAVLQRRQPLRELGTCSAVPHTCASLAFSSVAAAVEDGQAPTLQAAWLRRHEVIPSALALPAREARQHCMTRCHKLSYCTCHREGKVIHSLWLKVCTWMKQFFMDKDLRSGEYVVLLRTLPNEEVAEGNANAREGGPPEAPVYSYTIAHIALHYLRPWRPTFLLTHFADQVSRAVALQGELGTFVTLCCGTLEPHFRTPHRFIEELDNSKAVDVCAARLSQRHTPWPHSVGLVRAELIGERVRVWDGAEAERAKQRRQRRDAPDMEWVAEVPDNVGVAEGGAAEAEDARQMEEDENLFEQPLSDF